MQLNHEICPLCRLDNETIGHACKSCLTMPPAMLERIANGINSATCNCAKGGLSNDELQWEVDRAKFFTGEALRWRFGYRRLDIKEPISGDTVEDIVEFFEASVANMAYFVVIDAHGGDADSSREVQAAIRRSQLRGSYCAIHITNAIGAALLAALGKQYRFGGKGGTLGDLSETKLTSAELAEVFDEAMSGEYGMEPVLSDGTPQPEFSHATAKSIRRGRVLSMEVAEAMGIVKQIVPNDLEAERQFVRMAAIARKMVEDLL